MNFTAGIFIKEKTKYFPVVTIAGAILNIAFNLWAIPIWGIMGAAFATLFSYILMAFLLYLFSQKIYPVPYEYGKVFSIFAIVLVIGGSYYYLLLNGHLIFVYKLGLMVAFIILLFAFRVIKKEEVFTTYKVLIGKK